VDDSSESLDQWVARSYAAGCDGVRRWLSGLQVDAATRNRAEFAAEQFLAAMHPDNFLATNPAAIRRAMETGGASLVRGMQLLAADMGRGRVSNTDESAFEVGRNLATTPGAVVLRNELVELIQYAPATPKVGQRPLLIVPPCINKYYILDLAADNSLVRHCLSEGHTVFMVSWRNPGSGEAHVGWDDYLRYGVVDTIAAVRDISACETVNALGFCVGGTILATALAALSARGEHPVESLTLLATLLDFTEVGQLEVFVDAAGVAMREATLGAGGIMSGRDLAGAFSALRPRDLVWNYVNRGYLQGDAPPAFDLLYWNADSTNLPGPMYCWYLRNMYLENNLREGGRLESLGVPVDLAEIDVPTYVVATREDHIVPWHSAFETTKLVAGDTRFVLGASGHIAGIVNPAHKKRRSYWRLADDARMPAEADDWFAAAVEERGSWWVDWSAWLAPFKGPAVAAPRGPGNAGHPALGAAPGEYVKVRI
jgi:polyhydroxyalkanoate synthase